MLKAQIGAFQQNWLAIEGDAEMQSAAAKVRLFTNTPTISINSVSGDFTEAVFTGYTALAVGTPTIRRNANFDVQYVYPQMVFQPSSGPASPVTVNGYWIDGTITAVLHWFYGEYFDTPFTFSSPTDALTFNLEFVIPNMLVYGGLCSVC